ncbi:MAG: hypothetical protein JNM88_09225 [Chitinophagaceae bacterium]|nr:hypothetical protein [Chitinophagaceae bacterium]
MNHHYLANADSNDYFGFKPGNDQLTNKANRLLKGKVEQNNNAFIVVSFRDNQKYQNRCQPFCVGRYFFASFA